MEERRLKGVNFHGTLRALERRSGAEALARVRAGVGGEGGAALRDGGIVTNGWYPASWYDAVLVAIEAEHPGQRGILRDLSRSAVVDDFSTIFRLISLVMSPERALSNATRVMARYVDGGKVTVLEAKEGMIHFAFDEFHGYTPRMWDDFVGGIEGVLEMMRVQRLPTKLIGGDGARAEVILRYSR